MIEIFISEKFIILLVIVTVFGFCFWQEYDEKKRDEAKHLLDKKTSVMSN